MITIIALAVVAALLLAVACRMGENLRVHMRLVKHYEEVIEDQKREIEALNNFIKRMGYGE